MIKIEKTTTGASVSFPYELRYRFRECFPSAKWNPSGKTWQVGPRTIKRLEGWAERVAASGVLEELAVNEDIELTDREVGKLQEELNRLITSLRATRKATGSAEEARTRAEELWVSLQVTRAGLDAAVAEKAAAEAACRAVQAEIEERIAPIASRDQIDGLRRRMMREWQQLTSARHSRFNEQQSEMREIRDALAEVGVACRAVTLAAGANWNRRDRDYDDLQVAIEFTVLE